MMAEFLIIRRIWHVPDNDVLSICMTNTFCAGGEVFTRKVWIEFDLHMSRLMYMMVLRKFRLRFVNVIPSTPTLRFELLEESFGRKYII
jgi:hypothetical protein